MIIQPPDRRGVPEAPAEPRDVANRLLRAMPAAVLADLQPRMELVELSRGQVIAQVGAAVEHLYFINRGLVSLMRMMNDGRSVEMATVGIEGMADPCTLLGLDHAIMDVVVHVPGEAWRVTRRHLLAMLETNAATRGLLEHYVQWLLDQMAQTSACNRLHGLEQRCARWLLTAHDNARADEFPLTQDYLAVMLGAQRSSVAEITAAFRDSGYIAYRAGSMHILNRRGLRRVACECYATVSDRLATGLA
jgi:CRP-like cAMP-binding protein